MANAGSISCARVDHFMGKLKLKEDPAMLNNPVSHSLRAQGPLRETLRGQETILRWFLR